LLTRVFGVHNLAMAEDVVQETLANAFESWSFTGVPEHYSALLATSAKNRAIDCIRRQRTALKFAPDLGRMVESEWTLRPSVDELFLPGAVEEDELRMMFSCCHPRLAEDAQVALILSLLCGFGAKEIAGAFLITEAAVEKRLSRGKKVLGQAKALFELNASDYAVRLSAVHRALYLLFSEGYHGACPDAVVRVDLCQEAMRLARLLVDRAPSANPATFALAALMCLNAARLPGRVDEAGNLKALSDQDRSTWDAGLIRDGLGMLDRSATGEAVSPYHLEAAIAAIHAGARSTEDTRWGDVVRLYDSLMAIRPSPVVALNRAMAIAQHEGPEKGLDAIRAIESAERLANYPFYAAASGELELRLGNAEAAREHFGAARRVARNQGERQFLERRIAECDRVRSE
jgi:RNA polymerase sigma-70 factor (ECF subfamily)